jgi:hypothetical protein
MGADVRFDQCLQGFASGLRHQVNITAIVHQCVETGLKAWFSVVLPR